MASAPKVLETAISVTSLRSRRASTQARAISCSTATNAFGKCKLSGAVVSGVMSSAGLVDLRSRSIFTEFGKGFLNHCFYPACRVGGQDVQRQFQPQESETQAASRNPCAA